MSPSLSVIFYMTLENGSGDSEEFCQGRPRLKVHVSLTVGKNLQKRYYTPNRTASRAFIKRRRYAHKTTFSGFDLGLIVFTKHQHLQRGLGLALTATQTE